MTEALTLDDYGVLTEPATFTIQRLLPGPVERLWSYLTDGDLRRQWLAAGPMEEKVGAPLELVWRNDELTQPAGKRPEGFAEEHRLQSKVTEIDPPRKLAISWGDTGGVLFELESQGDEVLLTVTHRRITERSSLLNISAGWHMHLDILAAKIRGETPTPFWDGWSQLKAEYTARIAT
ncbi:MAG: SRPBCC family protein [Sphingosinicella sp.]|nr:SRPBCC family protein [Sphingosinicella sp.]